MCPRASNEPESDRSEIAEKFILFFNLGLLVLLTVFGTTFSKFHLFGPLYLHDFLLVLGCGLTFILLPRRFTNWPINMLIGISVAYLIYSFCRTEAGSTLIIRQFALFGYMTCYYLLSSSYSKENLGLIIRFQVIFSYTAIILQTFLIGYVIVFEKFDPTNFHNHYWYSPAVVVGLIIAQATLLLYQKNIFKKVIFSAYLLFLCWTTGHASAILAVTAIFGTHVILLLNGWKKLLPIAAMAILIVALMSFVPQFKDRNTDWRIFTWEYMVKELATDKYLILGHGFGTPYFSKDLENLLYSKISSTAMLESGKADERYLSPPHNSFLTIMFSIGILPGFLIFVPYFFIVVDASKTFREIPKESNYFMLMLVGLGVWAGFNVVLELPHSAGFFWLVYFTYWKLRAPDLHGLHSPQRFSNQTAP